MTASSKWIEGLTPTTPVDDAARRSLGPRLSAVAQALPLAAHMAEHDIEHVHRLRVSTRRAAAALKLYRPFLAKKHARWMKKRLRKIRRAAGDARDLDVMADRIARDYGESAQPIIDLIVRDRAEVQPVIQKIAELCRVEDRLVRKSSKLLDSTRNTPTKQDEDQPTTFQTWARPQLAHLAQDFLAGMPDESSNVAELHQFRIRAKHLRYAIELVAPAFDSELRETLYPIVEEVQERLGRVQDHVAALDRCERWRAELESDGSASLRETIREFAEAERRAMREAIADFHAWWSEERAAQVRQLIDSATESEPAAANVTEHPQAAHQT
jgi:CHAD domain-containing protein